MTEQLTKKADAYLHKMMETKIHVPPWRKNSVARPRLRQHLHDGFQNGRKLTLITAPAGYGKTMLAAAWIHSRSLPTAWLSLDDHDNELGRFLNYLLLALRALVPDVGQHLQTLLDAPQLPAVEEIAGRLLADLDIMGEEVASTDNGRFLLAFDDYHKIRQPLVHELLNELIGYLPPTCHLLLISREDPPLPLPRLRVRGELTEVRAQDLRFTLAEADQFFNQAMQLALPPAWVSALAERTEGWIASLHLAALSLQGRDAVQAERFVHEFSGSHRYVFDYLAEEVLEQHPEEMGKFLRATAVLDRFNASLCQALTGRADSKAILQRLEQANLFLVPLDDGRVWFRYHHLFADYLRSGLSPDEAAQHYRAASRWCDQNGFLFEAVQYALTSGDADFAADVIERALERSATWASGNVAQFLTWLEALPPQTVSQRPQLSLNASRILFTWGRFDQAESAIDQAEQALQALPATPDTEQLLALAALYRGSIASVRGDAVQAITQIEATQAGLSPDNHLAQARALFSLGQAYHLSGQTTRAVESYLASAEAARTAGVLFLVVHARCAAARLHILQGRLRLAEQTCQQALQFAENASIPLLGLARSLLGSIALEHNDLPAADKLLQEGISLSRQGRLMDDLTWGLIFLARLRAAQGNVAAALAAMQEVQTIVQAYGVPRMSLLVSTYLARIQLNAGQQQAAAQWAADYRRLPAAVGREFEDLTLARILLATGDLDPLPALLHPLLAQAEAAGRGQSCLEAMLLLGLYHHARRETAVAQEWISQAVQLAAPEGYARLLLEGERPLLDLLPTARMIAPDWLDKVMAMAHSAMAHPSVEPRAALLVELVEPLSEQELNVLRLLCAGKSNREIAAELFISPGTAKWHVHNILQKLDVGSRAQAIVRARELGLAG
jgi:LuxR family transcriptional regulator, maltose regulon positive regulatory protein